MEKTHQTQGDEKKRNIMIIIRHKIKRNKNRLTHKINGHFECDAYRFKFTLNEWKSLKERERNANINANQANSKSDTNTHHAPQSDSINEFN